MLNANYSKALQLAVVQDLPKHHKSDLTEHDKRAFHEHPDAEWIWGISDMGTYLYRLTTHATDNGKYKPRDFISSVRGCYAHTRFYILSKGNALSLENYSGDFSRKAWN